LGVCQKTKQDTENVGDLQGITLDVRKTNIFIFLVVPYGSDSKTSLI